MAVVSVGPEELVRPMDKADTNFDLQLVVARQTDLDIVERFLSRRENGPALAGALGALTEIYGEAPYRGTEDPTDKRRRRNLASYITFAYSCGIEGQTARLGSVMGRLGQRSRAIIYGASKDGLNFRQSQQEQTSLGDGNESFETASQDLEPRS